MSQRHAPCFRATPVRQERVNDGINSSYCNGCGAGFLGGCHCFHCYDLDHTANADHSRNSEWKLRERESLYKEFITEASRLTVDAVAHFLEQPDQLMALYGILSCIRLMSGEEVVRQGEACCRRIVELYGRPNLTTDQIRAAIEAHDLDEIDPLKEFSTACRNELLARQW